MSESKKRICFSRNQTAKIHSSDLEIHSFDLEENGKLNSSDIEQYIVLTLKNTFSERFSTDFFLKIHSFDLEIA
jgi:hypothetical protein